MLCCGEAAHRRWAWLAVTGAIVVAAWVRALPAEAGRARQAAAAAQPPTPPVRWLRLRWTEGRLAEGRALGASGRVAEALRQIAPLGAWVEALAWPRLQIRWQILLGSLRGLSGQPALAEKILLGALAAARGHPGLQAEAWTELLRLRAARTSMAAIAGDAGLARAVADRLAPGDPRRARLADALGALHLARGAPARALGVLQIALDGWSRRSGPESLEALHTASQIVVARARLGQLQIARDESRRLLRHARESLGRLHVTTARLALQLGRICDQLGDRREARESLEEAERILTRVLDPGSRELAEARLALAVHLGGSAQTGRALLMLEVALRARAQALGADDFSLAPLHSEACWLLLRSGRPVEAEIRCRRALALHDAGPDPRPPGRAKMLARLGAVLLETGRPEAAVVQLERALAQERAPRRAARSLAAKAQFQAAWRRWMLARALQAAGRAPERVSALAAEAKRRYPDLRFAQRVDQSLSAGLNEAPRR